MIKIFEESRESITLENRDIGDYSDNKKPPSQIKKLVF